MALIGSVVAIAVAKQVYGGLGYNPFNPALVARVVLLISFPVQMTTWTAPAHFGSGIDAVTSATPLGEMKTAVMLTGHIPAALQEERPYFSGDILPARRSLGRRPAARSALPALEADNYLAHPLQLSRHRSRFRRPLLAA
jgi:hypothetical protein